MSISMIIITRLSELGGNPDPSREFRPELENPSARSCSILASSRTRKLPSRLTTPPTYAASCGARAPPDPRPHDRFLACSVVTVYRGALVATIRPVRRRGIAPIEMFSRMTCWEYPNVIPCKNLKILKSSFLPRRGRNFGITERCGPSASVCHLLAISTRISVLSCNIL